MLKNTSDQKLDTMDEEWIPKHKVLAHRTQKLNPLFGSGGSTSRWGINGEKFDIDVPGFI
ncbi:uncharacterized protein EAF01_007127 [Botrytis porri]|uniref:uncharacterized protein n=1 Tax=Botrytis porri TaxID=87229 RepID=UPI00190245CC|nr:uncharacterized protein EAF01_007127 [Botrytis porri]KAF7901829.1 hypothetical protein EAF01_007127 [Botrytis porri]